MRIYKYNTKINKKNEKNFDFLVLEKQAVTLKDMKRKKIGNPIDVYDIALKLGYEDETEEVFLVFTLNTKNEVSGLFEVSRGSLNSSIVHPREVFKKALITNSNNIIIAHNHPSGNTRPSEEDKLITNRLAQVGEMLGISILDHIIIGDHYLSFKEEGLM